jgi:hypothetical protein
MLKAYFHRAFTSTFVAQEPQRTLFPIKVVG